VREGGRRGEERSDEPSASLLTSNRKPRQLGTSEHDGSSTSSLIAPPNPHLTSQTFALFANHIQLRQQNENGRPGSNQGIVRGCYWEGYGRGSRGGYFGREGEARRLLVQVWKFPVPKPNPHPNQFTRPLRQARRAASPLRPYSSTSSTSKS
jgi:hypothetical protein